MKKLLCLLLALVCITACVSCVGGGNNDNDDGAVVSVETIAGIINGSTPTKITTKVEYIVEGEETIVSSYDTEKDEANGIYVFTFNAKRPADVLELLPTNIKTISGSVRYNADGTITASTGDTWSKEDAVGYLPEMINIGTSSFKTCELKNNGEDLTGTVAAKDAKRVFGEDMPTVASDITVEIDTNGTYLYTVTIEYTSASGATVKVSTSYDYAVINLKDN